MSIMTKRLHRVLPICLLTIAASIGSVATGYCGEVRGVATDLNVTIPLVGVLVEAFEVDAVGNVAGEAFTSIRTLQDGSFQLPVGNVDRRVLLKFSQAGRTDVFIPNLAQNQASGALVIGSQVVVDDLIVIVPAKRPCNYSVPRYRHHCCAPRMRSRCR